MKQYYTYILKCSDNSFYTGVTNDLERRITEHQSGSKKSAYTFSRRPITLVWFESFLNINEAILVEKKIKGWSRRKKKSIN